MKIILLIVTIATFAVQAQATRVIDLTSSELQAVEFYSKCANQLKNKNYKVVSGNKSASPGFGVAYWFELNFTDIGNELPKVAHISVRWEEKSRTFDCVIPEELVLTIPALPTAP